MRHVMSSTFQTLTHKSSFILEFSHVLFVITLLQVAVFGHYYQQTQRMIGNSSSSIFQEEDFQSSPLYEKALKEIVPFSHLYFQESSLFLSTEGRMLTNTMSTPLLFVFNTEDSFSAGMPHNFFSKTPKPTDPNIVAGSSLEEIKETSGYSLAEVDGMLEERESKHFSVALIHRIDRVLEIKRHFLQLLSQEMTPLKNESINGFVSQEGIPSLPNKGLNLSFKPFYTYEKQASRLLNYWLQLTAPNENVPLEEIPFREGLIKTFFSKDFHPYMNEGHWFADSDEDEKIKREISQNHAKAFYAYLRAIEWEKTEYKTLFDRPQVPEDEDFHQAKFEPFLYAYTMMKQCAPGFCEKSDLCAR